MAEVRVNKPISRRIRHRGRASQIPIYVGKQLRFFIYQSDWKVLPMAAIIAALVSMVIRKDFFLTMEGNLKGAFALTCVRSGTAASIPFSPFAVSGPSSSGSTGRACTSLPMWRPI